MMTRTGWLVVGGLALLAGCSSAPEKKAVEAPKKEKAPELFHVKLDTSKGPVTVEIHREWAPIGVDHFYNLVKTGFFDNARFFRVVRGFVVQFGIAANPETHRLWQNTSLPDDPVQQPNTRGMVTYATPGPNSRTTQIFINLRDNRQSLDKQGFAPFGKVTEGMDVVDSFYNSYGDMAPNGQGPDPQLIQTRGNEYLESRFPRLDYIKKATIE